MRSEALASGDWNDRSNQSPATLRNDLQPAAEPLQALVHARQTQP